MPPEELDQLAAHLDECERCQSTLSLSDNHNPLLDALRVLGASPPYAREPECDNAIRRIKQLPDHNKAVNLQEPPRGESPIFLGRYRVQRRIGSGSFGIVFQAFDPELERWVALKTPHDFRRLTERERQSYREEARNLARLKHSGIVPIYDWEQDEKGGFFFVSEYVAGRNLAQRIADGKLSLRDAADIAATVAEALHYAHRHRLVHRDVKPANILLADADEAMAIHATRRFTPLLADFGMALRDEDVGRGPQFAGTPSYMSPEQARGEGHLVDARTDVYSLGVVLYEMLTGKLPFTGANSAEVREQIKTREPRAPRQIDDAIPRELDRICLKSLAKRLADRYSTASDMAQELRAWLAEPQSLPATAPSQSAGPSKERGREQYAGREHSDSSKIAAVVPKGLRSFDAQDADFFLELLPGPRDRRGWPESIRFWISRLESSAADAFRVGVIYGPSGCGKSSFVKAGLLPRLSNQVAHLYVEADANATEARLWRGLSHLCPEVCDAERTASGLADAIARVRRGAGLAAGRKLLIIVDQFEQWLHANGDGDTPLSAALRQCDGRRVQCLLLVRDDFWMPLTRLAREIDAPIVDGENAAALDLFDVRHARKVLAAFGEAYDRLSADSSERDRFLSEAVIQLSQNDRVSPVRLGVFVEMLRDRPWTTETLRATGGIEGLGARFLEMAFSDSSAPPEHRRHEKAVRGILQELLPQHGLAIKGRLRTRGKLLAASGYASRPADFEAALRILDGSLRLITPVSEDSFADVAESSPRPPNQMSSGGSSAGQTSGNDGPQGDTTTADAPTGPRRYQLTHDYLVPSIRQWLTRKQRETRRGRAQLRLDELTGAWTAAPQSRNLPAVMEWIEILTRTRHRDWSGKQRRMMRMATWRHLSRMALAAIVFAAAAGVWSYRERTLSHERFEREAEKLVDTLVSARPDEVPRIAESLRENSQGVKTLERRLVTAELIPSIRIAGALAELGATRPRELLRSFESAPSQEGRNVNRSIVVARKSMVPDLWARYRRETIVKTRVRLALTLLYAGDRRAAQEMLRIDSDSTSRTAMIHGMKDWQGDFIAIADLLRNDKEPSFQSGICAALGNIAPSDLFNDEKAALTRSLREVWETSLDAGAHGAAGWALAKWKESHKRFMPGESPQGANWFVNDIGATMIKMAPGKFMMGLREGTAYLSQQPKSPAHETSIDRAFYIADREFTVGDYLACLADAEYPAVLKPAYANWEKSRLEDSPFDECPAPDIPFSDALRLCNWLSWKENRAPCYRFVEQPKRDGSVVTELGRAGQWRLDLSADGYRLPTSAEWEYACRAGAATDFHFGNDPSLLDRYAVVGQNFAEPVARRLPNAWGLFDVHGNIAEWCWDDWDSSKTAGSPKPFMWEQGSRINRGGTWFLNVRPCPCGFRNSADWKVDDYNYGVGFRVVCNIPPPNEAPTDGDAIKSMPNSISGRLFHDYDGLGKFDDGDAPLVDVTVFLDRPEGAEKKFNQQLDEGELRVQSDAEGRFLFSDIAPGDYRVTNRSIPYAAGALDVRLDGANAVQEVHLTTYWFRTHYGQVFHDRNENGARDEGEEGLIRQLYVDRNSNRIFEGSEFGENVFDSTSEGVLSMTASPSKKCCFGIVPVPGWRCTSPEGDYRIFSINSREPLPSLDFGFVMEGDK